MDHCREIGFISKEHLKIPLMSNESNKLLSMIKP